MYRERNRESTSPEGTRSILNGCFQKSPCCELSTDRRPYFPQIGDLIGILWSKKNIEENKVKGFTDTIMYIVFFDLIDSTGEFL